MLRLMVSRLHFSKSFCSSQGNVYLRQTKAQTFCCFQTWIYIYREGVGGQDCGNAMINGFSEA